MANKTLISVDDFTPKELFHKPVVYEIPYYQRGYVWNEQDQWQPLWEDIETQAENYLNLKGEEESNNPYPAAHFMGAIVLQEIQRSSSDIEKHAVVDGQQRLTTIQILLAAIKTVVQKKSQNILAKRVQNLIENGEEYIEKNDAGKQKVSSSRTDREAFIGIMESNSSNPKRSHLHLLQKAYNWFHTQATKYLADASTSDDLDCRATALVWAATQGIQFVVIDVDRASDANEIFDSLNSRGTPLLTADQAKNFMYLEVRKENGILIEDQIETRMKNIWPFDESNDWNGENENQDWWHQELKIGRLGVVIEAFLRHWLTLRLEKEVKTKDVMNEFKTHVRKEGLDKVGEDLQMQCRFYKEILKEDVKSDSFLFRWRRALQATTMLPVLLRLRQFEEQERKAAERHLESYGMRRWICQLTNAGQTNAMVTLLKKLDDSGLNNASEIVKEFLAEQSERSRVWPNNREVQSALAEEPVIRSRNIRMAKIILLAIEQHMRSPISEQKNFTVEDVDKLQIEHLWPQSWEENWDEPSNPKVLDQIGNLTLVSPGLNPVMSNSVWDKKKKDLKAHSMLKLNEKLLEHQGPWDEPAIQARSAKLAEIVVEIWSRPSV